jgi:hypothetical protein
MLIPGPCIAKYTIVRFYVVTRSVVSNTWCYVKPEAMLYFSVYPLCAFPFHVLPFTLGMRRDYSVSKPVSRSTSP